MVNLLIDPLPSSAEYIHLPTDIEHCNIRVKPSLGCLNDCSICMGITGGLGELVE